jgi:uncharacterized membrane protein
VAEDNGADESTNGQGSTDLIQSALQHKGLLLPAVVGAAGAIAAAKGPDVMRGLRGSVDEKVASTAEQAGAKAVEGAKQSIGGGGGGGLATKAIGKLTGLGGGGGGGGAKKTRRLPIQRWTDVAVPVEDAYEAWTEFDNFPKFMHRVLSVEQKEEDKVSWQEKIWFSKRQWEGRITERRENDRIVWKTTSGTSHKGIVSFHKLGDRLTRVMVEMEFEPTGMIEKMGSGLRFVKRAVQADLARFKAYVELRDVKGLDYRAEQSDEQQGEDENDDGAGQEAGSSRTTKRRSSSGTRSSSSGTRSRSGTASRSSSSNARSGGARGGSSRSSGRRTRSSGGASQNGS